MSQHSVEVVVFHDRGVGRETRILQGGKIQLRDNPDREMLCDTLCTPVEQAINDGINAGFTDHPSYPSWYVTTISARAA
jgi:hypothetical protein